MISIQSTGDRHIRSSHEMMTIHHLWYSH